MHENIIPFPKNESAQVGFYELKDIQLTFSNLFNQTLDPGRYLNTQESITSVNSDITAIKNKISVSIEALNGLRAEMPTPHEFRKLVWDVLCLPFQYGSGRAAMNYYVTEAALKELTDQYNLKREDIKKAAM